MLLLGSGEKTSSFTFQGINRLALFLNNYKANKKRLNLVVTEDAQEISRAFNKMLFRN